MNETRQNKSFVVWIRLYGSKQTELKNAASLQTVSKDLVSMAIFSDKTHGATE